MYDPATARSVFLRSQPPRLVPEGGIPGRDYIETKLNYFSSTVDGERPYNRRYPSEDLPETNILFEEREERVYDLRKSVNQGREDETSIDKTGFAIIGQGLGKTVMKEIDFEDEKKIKEIYYHETIALIKRVTGATRVDIFDHTIRRSDAEGIDSATNRKPVAQVHVDQTPLSGQRRVERHCGSDATRLLAGKASLINVWRVLRPGGDDRPLAFCDSRSLGEEDLIPSRLLFELPTPEGETFQVKRNVNHRFYYLSKMDPNECIFLQCWSTDPKAAKTPHSGVENKPMEGKVEPRRSIEIRALVFWEE